MFDVLRDIEETSSFSSHIKIFIYHEILQYYNMNELVERFVLANRKEFITVISITTCLCALICSTCHHKKQSDGNDGCENEILSHFFKI